MRQILVVDDDVHIGELLREVLSEEGYGVVCAYSGTEALLQLSAQRFDLILLDLMLPGLSGEELHPKLLDLPVIVMSAKVDVSDKVSLLRGGAVDYVTKPFVLEELLARIAVQFRRVPQLEDSDTLDAEGLTLSCDLRTVTADGRSARLTRTEFAILKLLMQHPTQVLTKTGMLDRIAVDTPDCTESSLKMHISNLRKKLREISGKDYIESIWGIGFKLKTE